MGKWILEGGIAIKRIYVFNQINIYINCNETTFI